MDNKEFSLYFKLYNENKDFRELIDRNKDKIRLFNDSEWNKIKSQNYAPNIDGVDDFYDMFYKGYNIGNCVNMTIELSYSYNDVDIVSGTMAFLKGTLNAEKEGGHAWLEDKDTIIAVSGGSKKEFLEQDVSEELEQLMDDKEVYTSNENRNEAMPITKNDNQQRKNNSQVVYPIISNGDTIGTVILLAKDPDTKMTDIEKKVAQSAATFLGTQMEI